MIKNILVVLLLFSVPCQAQNMVPAPYSQTGIKWAKVAKEMDRDRETLAACRRGDGPCPAAATRFMGIIQSVQGLYKLAQVGILNRTINLSIRATPDPDGIDIWSSPLATFETGKGDCEDYAIAKIVALEELGFPRENIRLVVLRKKNDKEDHAVTSVLVDGDWRIMDNLTLFLVKETELRSDLYPIYRIQP